VQACRAAIKANNVGALLHIIAMGKQNDSTAAAKVVGSIPANVVRVGAADGSVGDAGEDEKKHR
jgi:hypothetical protein